MCVKRKAEMYETRRSCGTPKNGTFVPRPGHGGRHFSFCKKNHIFFGE